ncbi:MAG: methylated-DNA--[protein]-cysteine S-methyltransferase [Magnetococcales bacterium]|nr:methylated-DNA--[protein]-cysteine S-methyltransferase [Magnetococcales bacterium]
MTNKPKPAITTTVGDLWLEIENGKLTKLSWHSLPAPTNKADRKTWEEAKNWLAQFFKNNQHPHPINFPINPKGTKFQNKVWNQLLKIPPGKTQTYGTVAKKLNTAPRAIGQAVGANPIPIIIPCHRVVAVNGLGGYSGLGGIECKKKLLELEIIL